MPSAEAQVLVVGCAPTTRTSPVCAIAAFVDFGDGVNLGGRYTCPARPSDCVYGYGIADTTNQPSESSLFVAPHVIILKTCGTTLNLLGLHRILDIAREYCGLTNVWRYVSDFFWSMVAAVASENQR